MPEPHPNAELHQPLGLGGIRRIDPDPEPLGRSPHQCRLAGRLGRRDQQQPLGLGRQLPKPSPKTVLDSSGERLDVREPEPACHLRRRQPTRQLQQRQRIAARLGDDPVAHAFIQRPPDHRVQQRPRITVT
jgi:hypothetical protein